MTHAALGRFVVTAALLLAMPAAAQNYGPQPGYMPKSDQPGYQPPPLQQPGPYQPAPTPPGGQAAGESSLIGTWSGTSNGTSGQIQIAEAYSLDGRFVSVGRLANGFIARFWGTYRFSPAGPNQFRLETQLEGWLPREVCQQMAGSQPQCQPTQFPMAGVSLVSFPSPNQLQSASQTEAGAYSVEQRDSQPVLLQVQAPQRWTNIIQPGPSAPPTYNPGPYSGPRPTYSPTVNRCNNDDIQTSICRYSGRLIHTLDGCLRCVS